MKITQTIFKNGQPVDDNMILYWADNQHESQLTGGDGVRIIAVSESEFGYEPKFEIILEREEFEHIKKL